MHIHTMFRMSIHWGRATAAGPDPVARAGKDHVQ
jgi:hypothetical protein